MGVNTSTTLFVDEHGVPIENGFDKQRTHEQTVHVISHITDRDMLLCLFSKYCDNATAREVIGILFPHEKTHNVQMFDFIRYFPIFESTLETKYFKIDYPDYVHKAIDFLNKIQNVHIEHSEKSARDNAMKLFYIE